MLIASGSASLKKPPGSTSKVAVTRVPPLICSTVFEPLMGNGPDLLSKLYFRFAAGSGKTTTLIARLGVLLGRGVAADRIGVVTFNRDAATELTARIAGRLVPYVPGAAAIEVRTLHALARTMRG